MHRVEFAFNTGTIEVSPDLESKGKKFLEDLEQRMFCKGFLEAVEDLVIFYPESMHSTQSGSTLSVHSTTSAIEPPVGSLQIVPPRRGGRAMTPQGSQSRDRGCSGCGKSGAKH